MKHFLIFLSNHNYISNDVIEFTKPKESNDLIYTPDDYVELIKFWAGTKFNQYENIKTYIDNWRCNDKTIISFIFNGRYCEISEIFGHNITYMTIRIYPSNYD
jgi:hypothetical protein